MPSKDEIQQHIDALNNVSERRKYAFNHNTPDANKISWEYAEESVWFFENGIEKKLGEDGKWHA